MNGKSFVAILVIAMLVFVLLSCGLISATFLGWQSLNTTKAPVAEETALAEEAKDSTTIEDPDVVPVQTGPTCEDRAKLINAPIGSSICKAPVSGTPAMRAQSGSQITFGTITFDAETRVWILEKFVVPSFASYAFDYNGREQNVLDAPFVVGSEKNPVDGQNFKICWDTTSDGCVPPTVIEFFQ